MVRVMTMVPLAEYFLHNLKFFSLNVPALDVFRKLSLTVGEELLCLESTVLFNGCEGCERKYTCDDAFWSTAPNCNSYAWRRGAEKMMYQIWGGRQSGKTTKLIKLCQEMNREHGKNDTVILVKSHNDAKRVKQMADDLGYHDMPFPVVLEEIWHKHATHYTKILADDMDAVFQHILGSWELVGYSITDKSVTTFADYLAEQMKNPEFKREWENCNLNTDKGMCADCEYKTDSCQEGLHCPKENNNEDSN